jgi:deoxycytidylate deaminase
MRLAEKVSRLSNHDKHKHGVVICRGSNVISLGTNQIKTHTRAKDYWTASIHAELSAIINAKRNDFTGCDIYVFRRNKINEVADSKPCTHCQILISSLNFRRVYYSSYKGIKCEKV